MTDVDLKPFCRKGFSTLDISRPWVRCGRKMATDGIVCIAVPSDEPDCESSRNVPDIASYFDLEGIAVWHALPDVCPACQLCCGSGFFLEPYHCPGGCEASGLWHKVQCGCYVSFGNRAISTRYAKLLATLPGIEWGIKSANSDDSIHFRFRGGCGQLMPLAQPAHMPSPEQPEWPRHFIQGREVARP